MQAKFTAGQQVKSKGVDANGNATIEAVRFVKYLPEPKKYLKPDYSGETVLDCVIQCRDGVKVMADSSGLLG